jgi:S1-C subfamily serine protease
MKYIFLLLSIISNLHASTVFSGEPDKKLHLECLYPTVMITNSRGSQGTGVIIRSDKIKDGLYHNVVLTCNHITANKSAKYKIFKPVYKEWSKLKDLEAYPARIYAQNQAEDLAIMIFKSTTQLEAAQLNLEPKLYIGNEVFRIGNGQEQQTRLDYGRITSLDSIVNDKSELIRTSIFTLSGDSGSPVYEDYKLVGIMIAVHRVSESKIDHISYFVPIQKLVKWDKTSGTISFAYDKTQSLPVFEYFMLDLDNTTFKQ